LLELSATALGVQELISMAAAAGSVVCGVGHSIVLQVSTATNFVESLIGGYGSCY
jgi:hypothetical protein